MPTRSPHFAAEAAAAMPAGPAPTTSTSKSRLPLLDIGPDIHAGLAQHLTTPTMPRAVDDDAALETNAHPAQRPAWPPADRHSARLSSQQGGIRDRCTRFDFHPYAVDRQRHSLRHGCALLLSAMGDMGR